MEVDDLVARIEQHDEVLVDDRLAAVVPLPDAASVEEHPHGAAESGLPVLRLHERAVRLQPRDVGNALAGGHAHRPAVEEAPAPEGGVVAAQPGQGGGELHQRLIHVVPVDPGDLVVLRVSVVVALLRAAQLVAVQQHRHALAEQQRRDEVALLSRAQRVHHRIVGRALDAEVHRSVVVGAVLAVLAVGLVVLVVVADQIAQREAVVRGHEVDRGDGATPGMLVEIRRAGQP